MVAPLEAMVLPIGERTLVMVRSAMSGPGMFSEGEVKLNSFPW